MVLTQIVALKAAVLGIVEGLTEFLPVSSTGHLIVVSRLLDWESPAFDIFIQVGAMFALTWIYRETIVHLLRSAPSQAPARMFLFKILVAFVPAALVGVVAHHWIEEHLFVPGFVAATTLVGGVLILFIDGPGRRGRVAELEQVSFTQAAVIGSGQVLSLLPGVSRSGATIVAGLLSGLERRVATDFSFFLALPTMYAACFFSLWKARHDLSGQLGAAMAIGLVTAFLSALVVIRGFLHFVQHNSLRPFGWYRIVAGLAVGAWIILL
jgi:undecaprenyl-diphosphatase